MRNVALYIAQRYNAHTLLISMLLIILCSFLVGTFVYIGENFFLHLRDILYQNRALGTKQSIVLFGSTIGYILVQIGLVWLIFNKLLDKLKKRKKLQIAFGISFLCLIGGLISIYLNFSVNIYASLIPSFLISISLLSFTYAILTIFFAKRKITGVNIITSIAVFAITIATSALFIILSVFSGLEKMNIQFFSNVNPDLKVIAAKGKTIPEIDKITAKLDSNGNISAYSKVIEEKVSIDFQDKQDIAYIKGIDEKYNQVVRIDTTLLAGNYFTFETDYQILASDGVARRLQMYIDQQNTAQLMMPKPGTGLISSEEEAFNRAYASPNGVLFINEQYDKYIFSPIGLTQDLLKLDKNQAYAIEIKLKNNQNLATAKKALQADLGNSVIVQTRQDLDATFLKVMNVENLIIYLIFTLVIIIASFNLAGAIIIIIIDKREQIKTMWSFGLPKNKIKQIFFNTGLLITLFSIFFGLLLGTTIGILQNKYSLVMANPFVAFPFEFTVGNFLVVIATVLLIGGGVSYIVSRKLPN